MALADINVRIGAEISQFQSGLRKAERELQRSADKFNQLGNNLSLALSLPLAAAGTAAFKFAAGFETATTKIENLVGVQGKELDDLKQKFKELGPVVGKTQTELADAALFITGAGLRGASALEALEISAKASAIGLGEQTAIAKVAGAAVAAYGSENISATQTVDKLLAAIKAGNAEAADLAPVLGRVLPVASQLGVSFDEVTANIATFTRLGINAEGAVDGLKSALTNILKPSEQADKALAKYGLTAQQVRDSIKSNGLAATLQDLIKVFGTDTDGLARVFGDVQGLTAILGTAGAQGEAYAQILKDIQNSAGGVDEAFKKTAETADFKLKKAFAGLSAAGTEIGATLVPVVVDLVNAVVPLVQGFASLDDGTKKLIVGFGLAAVAAGPLFKLIGGSIQIYSAARSAILSFAKASEVAGKSYEAFQAVTAAGANNLSAFQNALKSAAVAWRALDTVAKATVIGAALAVVVALGVAFNEMSKQASGAALAQKAVNDVSLEAQKSIVSEKNEAERLTGVLKDNTAGYDEKKAALKRLQEISPAYFGDLNLENLTLDSINGSLEKYIENLRRSATARAASAKLDDLARQKLDLEAEGPKRGRAAIGVGLGLEKSFEQKLADIAAQEKELGKVLFESTKKVETAQDDLLEKYYEERDLIEELGKKKTDLAKLTPGAPLATGGGKSGKASKTDPIRSGLPGAFEFKDVASGYQLIADGVGQYSEALDRLGEASTPIVESQALMAFNNSQLAIFSDEATLAMYAQADAMATLQKQMDFMATAGEAVGNAILQASESGAAGLGQLAKAAANAARAFIRTQIAEGVAAQIKAALVSAGPAGLFLAPIAGAAAAAIFDRIIPKFAEGGLAYGPTYGLMGEYPGARNNPEVIAPLSKLKGMLADSGGGRVQVYGRLSGNDILLSSERSGQRRRDIRGY